MKRWRWIVLFGALIPAALGAKISESQLRVEGNLSFWWTIMEQVENQENQAGSGDLAAQEASGFNFKQGRIGFAYLSPQGRVESLIRIRLEERTDVLDFWGAFHAAPWFNFYVGEMKIPSTAEALSPDYLTDFIVRSAFAQNVGDFSLARTPYISSLMSIRSYDRDLGIAFKGSVPGGEAPRLDYFLMVANGIGGNNYVGGNASSEFLYTNHFGDYYYGARLELAPVRQVILGGHYSLNRHDNAILQDKQTVVDFERTVWTADAQVELPWQMRLAGFYGQGGMQDFFNSQDYQFDYRGWGAWVLQALWKKRIELGVRYDSFTTEFQRDGNETEQRNWTFGVNFRPTPNFRFQLNYMDKDTRNEFKDDVDDNLLFMNLQFMFEQAFSGHDRSPDRNLSGF